MDAAAAAATCDATAAAAASTADDRTESPAFHVLIGGEGRRRTLEHTSLCHVGEAYANLREAGVVRLRRRVNPLAQSRMRKLPPSISWLTRVSAAHASQARDRILVLAQLSEHCSWLEERSKARARATHRWASWAHPPSRR